MIKIQLQNLSVRKKELESPEFILDLGIVYDVLQELSMLSNGLVISRVRTGLYLQYDIAVVLPIY